MSLLEVTCLRVTIPTSRGLVEAVRGVSFTLEQGKTLGLVGESGCGKTMTGLAIIGLPPAGACVQGSIRLEGRELVGIGEREYRRLRGSDIGMVFQDPSPSLNPLMRVGDQVAESIRLHRSVSAREARRLAEQELAHVRLPAPSDTYRRYPHQLSGGQQQRVLIAMALACRPKLLIADEPTTALDVTLQAQILALLRDLQGELGLACVFISHDLGVVGALCDSVAVMYAGRIVEAGTPQRVIGAPRHPYTVGLLNSLPRQHVRPEPIPGQPPGPFEQLAGCPFEPRCPRRLQRCAAEPPTLEPLSGGTVACWSPVEEPVRA